MNKARIKKLESKMFATKNPYFFEFGELPTLSETDEVPTDNFDELLENMLEQLEKEKRWNLEHNNKKKI